MSPIDSKTYNLLFDQVKNGNQCAFTKLFDLYWQSMFTAAKAIVMDESVAKDIVQDIWLNLWQKRKKLDIENFEGYIFKSVNYGCFKFLRDNKFNTAQSKAIASLQFTVASEVENKHNLEDTQLVIETALTALPPRCQQIFRLSRFQAVSNDEIAVQLGISKRSVENQMSIALKFIKQNLLTAQSFLLGLSIFFT